MPDIIGMGAVAEYFRTTWAPAVVHLHTPGGGILAKFLADLCTELDSFIYLRYNFPTSLQHLDALIEQIDDMEMSCFFS